MAKRPRKAAAGEGEPKRAKREQRSYTPADIANALDAYVMTGGYLPAQRVTGIPDSTIAGWVDDPENAEELGKARERHTRAWEGTLHARALGHMRVEMKAQERALEALDGNLPTGLKGGDVAAIYREATRANESYQKRLRPVDEDAASAAREFIVLLEDEDAPALRVVESP